MKTAALVIFSLVAFISLQHNGLEIPFFLLPAVVVQSDLHDPQKSLWGEESSCSVDNPAP